MNLNMRPAHILVNTKYAPHAVAYFPCLLENVHMPHPNHYLRQWRKSKGLTQQQLADRLEALSEDPRFISADNVRPKGTTYTTLGRVERGEIPYGQTLLEMLADIYGTDPGSLIMRNPEASEPLYSIWDSIPKAAQAQALAYLQGIVDASRRTGTGG